MLCISKKCCIFATAKANVAQLVEHQLPKLRVAGSNPVIRSKLWGCASRNPICFYYSTGVPHSGQNLPVTSAPQLLQCLGIFYIFKYLL